MSKGLIFVISAPSGAGKSTLCQAMIEKDPGLRLSISCTTRPPRPNEKDGHEYFFLSESKFKKKDGSLLHCLLSGNAVWGKDGNVIGYQGIAKDITARMDAIPNFRQRHREVWVLNAVAFAMNKTHDLDSVL